MQNIGSGVLCGLTYRSGDHVDAMGFIFYGSICQGTHQESGKAVFSHMKETAVVAVSGGNNAKGGFWVYVSSSGPGASSRLHQVNRS